jgi:hypothetical protein
LATSEESSANNNLGGISSGSKTPVQLALKLPKSIPMNQDKRGGMFAAAAAAAAAAVATTEISAVTSSSSSVSAFKCWC